jgi:hypothetical protein
MSGDYVGWELTEVDLEVRQVSKDVVVVLRQYRTPRMIDSPRKVSASSF